MSYDYTSRPSSPSSYTPSYSVPSEPKEEAAPSTSYDSTTYSSPSYSETSSYSQSYADNSTFNPSYTDRSIFSPSYTDNSTYSPDHSTFSPSYTDKSDNSTYSPSYADNSTYSPDNSTFSPSYTDNSTYSPDNSFYNHTNTNKSDLDYTSVDYNHQVDNSKQAQIDQENYNYYIENNEYKPVTHVEENPVVVPPPAPPSAPVPREKEEKKGGSTLGKVLPWVAGAAALFFGGKAIFGGKKPEEPETPEKPGKPHEPKHPDTPETPKTPKKPGTPPSVTTDVKVTGYGDPVFTASLKNGDDIKDIVRNKGGVAFQDETSSLEVGMNESDPKHVFMNQLKYDAGQGSVIEADADGSITVAGVTLKEGQEVALENGGTASLQALDGESDGGFENMSKLVIKSPNEGSGSENITAFVRKNKRGHVMYEFDMKKSAQATDKNETVTDGFLLPFFDAEYKAVNKK
jgi:hypothetical protein